MSNDDIDTTEQIYETERGYTLHVSSKRGTGTRDEDKVSLTAHTETLDQLTRQRAKINGIVTAEMDARREHQPDNESDNDDE